MRFPDGWPYATKAIFHHEFDTDHLNIWVIFKFSMDTSLRPGNAKWLVNVDNVQKPVTVSSWQDMWTLLLTVPNIVGAPDRVLVAYDGPDRNLRITWEKQWEGFGEILSIDQT